MRMIALFACALALSGCAEQMVTKVAAEDTLRRLDIGKANVDKSRELAYCFGRTPQEAADAMNELFPPILEEGLKKIPDVYPVSAGPSYGQMMDNRLAIEYFRTSRDRWMTGNLSTAEQKSCVSFREKNYFLFTAK